MSRPPMAFRLKTSDANALEQLLDGGVQQVRVVLRVLALLQLDRGTSAPNVAAAVRLSALAIRNIAERYRTGGLMRALYERSRPGAAEVLTPADKQRLIAMVCADPPVGAARWTVRLIAEEAVKRKVVPQVGRETIRVLLQSHDLKPWREKMWCIAELNAAYRANMEDVLALYERPYDPKEPVICLDEKPVALHADVRAPRPARPGHLAKRDNEYKRCGVANIFGIVEPKAGRHFTCATPNRSAAEFAKRVRTIVDAYPAARTIHLAMDNLNTHTEKALADRFGPRRGRRLWRRLTVHYTPKHGSWLNQAEIELSLVARQCLGNRRIAALDQLQTTTRGWNTRANRRHTKIAWRFTRKDARRKFGYQSKLSKRSKT